jgi:PLP dependent protein
MALKALEARIQAACQRSHRSRSEVTLVGVSKRHPSAAIREGHALGLRHFGENYAQELRDKAQELAELEIQWHAIGTVQLKNAKYIARHAQFFHALESLPIAEELSRRRVGLQSGYALPHSFESAKPNSALPPLKCFVEVNVAQESSKAGLTLTSLGHFIDAVRALAGLELVGLTAMPPLTENPQDSRTYFQQLKQLADSFGLHQLSMGTTGDFEVALEEGATHIRVGTALFGERPSRS